MLNKLLFLLLLSVPLFAKGWSTATSVTVGAKYLNYIPSSFDARIEQYFIHDDLHLVYYKIGYFHEQLKAWQTHVDSAHDVQLGMGLNLFAFGDAFIDAGISVAYRIAYNAQATSTAKVVYTDLPIVPFGEIGLGYSFGDFTLRADFMLGSLLSGKVDVFKLDGSFVQTVAYDQYHMNIGLFYWW